MSSVITRGKTFGPHRVNMEFASIPTVDSGILPVVGMEGVVGFAVTGSLMRMTQVCLHQS